MEPDTSAPSPPRTAPTDTAEELTRLRADAAARGVDADAAIELAHALKHTLQGPDALRAVDRRIASGMSVDDARRLLLDEDV